MHTEEEEEEQEEQEQEQEEREEEVCICIIFLNLRCVFCFVCFLISFLFSLNLENVGDCCKRQRVCVHQRIPNAIQKLSIIIYY